MQLKKGLILSCLLLGIAFAFMATYQADASCGQAVSTCRSCHDIQKNYPVADSGPWHKDHSFSDLCDSCHGGMFWMKEKEQAHQDMVVNPLEDAESVCGGDCHESDLEAKVAVYTDSLNSGGAAGGGGGQTVAAGQSGAGEPQGQSVVGNTILVILNLLMLGLLAFFVWKYDFKGTKGGAA